MKRLALSLVLLVGAVCGAHATCIGTNSYYTCSDSSGNTYNVNRIGNTTTVNGYNANTGSSWNQNTYRSGNTSSTYGTAADGSSWNSQTYRTPSGSTTYGTDSRGNSFSRTCNQFGCF
jgi:hypothetical protein